jgi:hypothetical protein
VRVRTYVFPGCFTRPPGTSTRHHPHEPTTSKPVVPGDVLPLQCSRARDTASKAGPFARAWRDLETDGSSGESFESFSRRRPSYLRVDTLVDREREAHP